MKVMLKNAELQSLYHALKNNLTTVKGPKLIYAVTKNFGILQSNNRRLEQAIQDYPEFVEFQKEQLELIKQYAATKEDGSLKTQDLPNGQTGFEIPKTVVKEFNEKNDELREKYKKAIEEREQQAKEYEELLEQEVELDFHPITEDCFSHPELSGEVVGLLSVFVE